MHDPRDLRQLVRDEITEQLASGRELGRLREEAEDWLAATPGAGDSRRFDELYEQFAKRSRNDSAVGREPSDIPAIERSLGPATAAVDPRDLDVEVLADRIHGAWLGRVAGCTMGKPVEGWPREAVRAYLDLVGGIPPTDYLPVLDPWPDGIPPMRPTANRATRGAVRGGPRDDDLDWTVVNLLALQRSRSVTATALAEHWLAMLPFAATYTAERVAYANLVAGLRPPESAERRNPYREWIGALIRADVYGWISPGDPRRAALMALRDASISHRGNGLYGAMWAAAAVAVASVGGDPRSIVAEATRHVPPGTRLRSAVESVLSAFDHGLSSAQMLDWLATQFGGYHWVHAINNTAVISAALLWGGGDPAVTIGLAVAAGWDTDSCGATAGSLAGAMCGTAGLPSALIEPLDDRLDTAVFGMGSVRVSELARQTLAIALAPAQVDLG